MELCLTPVTLPLSSNNNFPIEIEICHQPYDIDLTGNDMCNEFGVRRNDDES